MKVTIHIWDLPLRLFHWLLAVAVAAAYITAKIGGSLIDWHGRIGIFILGLLVFRVLWGFVGSTHARFLTFFPTPSKLLAYFKGRWHGIGHNPLGALSVFALLAVVAAQVGTGLFANDDIAFVGPLFNFVDKSLSDRLTGLHNTIFDLLVGFIVLHVVAIIFYRWVKKTNLVVPMLTGKKQVPKTVAASLTGRPVRGVGAVGLILSLIISCTVVWGVTGGIAYLHPAESYEQTAQATQADPGF
ncbi:cytochrome b/b6 domain-containing protein [Candidatus Methylobacter oryzae]|uniref:Cytochrome B n=1 Tax=Candidatus Methylobacter oryzae TaxID=2497749 RepID=A0ABY3CF09_9GAMM|nr:cytochrome b/b6 domain-containing protein [Candidatus Methylobacter oryzae]TRX01628.1 cytochrome B [Candidatus Methylobacter oryzae]